MAKKIQLIQVGDPIFEVRRTLSDEEIAEIKEFERLAADAAESREAEWQAATGNPNFQRRPKRQEKG